MTTVTHTHIQNLPTELIIEILSLTSATSHGNYRSLLLVSKQFNRLSRLYCLQAVPVVLEGYEQLSSFHRLLRASPGTHGQVRYLWIMGDGLTCSNLIESILRSCTRIVCLACTSRTIVSLCTSMQFEHTQCTELTLMETWHPWKSIMTTPHGQRFCGQIRLLRMHEGLSPEFPRQHFTHLTHIAFSSRPIREYLERHLQTLKHLPVLQQLVVTTYWWRDMNPDSSISDLLNLDQRLSILHCHKGWTELEAWKDGVIGGFSLWDQAIRERKSMKVFRGAFAALSRRV